MWFKLENLKWEDYTGLSQWTLNVVTNAIVRTQSDI